MHLYRVSGLAVASDLDLPGLNVLKAGKATPDAFVRAGAVPEGLNGASTSGPTWQLAGKDFLLRIPGIARFLLRDGREITYEAEPGSDAADIPVFILGTVFGILLHQRGQIVLHASAVQVAGRAILFCGPSGAGKSSLAAALSQRGYPLLTDDICAISIDAQGIATVHPDGRQLKLWTQAINRLDLGASRGERVRRQLEKFYVAPDGVHAEAVPLGAVYALFDARPPLTPGIERPNAVEAALLLRRNAYRPMLVHRLGQRAGYFHAATTIANTAGIYSLTRQLDFADMPNVIGWLEQHWRGLGLMEKAA